MPNSKLVALLAKLNSKEWLRLQDFIYSPYFNKRPEVCKLFDFFYAHKNELATAALDRPKIYQFVFPGETYKDKNLAYHFNYLLRLAEDFLTQEDIQADTFYYNRNKLTMLLEKRLTKHFNFQFKKLNVQLEKDTIRSDHYWRDRFLLAEMEAQAFMNKRQRQYDESFQRLSDSLDAYYFFEKLRYSCAMVNLEAIGSSKYNIQFIDEIINHFGGREGIDFHLDIYLNIYQCLTEQEHQEAFTKLKNLIFEHQKDLAKEEFREIVLFTINICARKIRQGFEEYYEQALEFYLLGIQSRSLFAGDNLTHWTFNNVTKIALRLKRYEWLESFIDENTRYLAPNVREESMNFSKAELAFSQKEYGEVLTYIAKCTFTDPQYFLGSRIILLKSFYATNAFDSMSSQLASFIMFLRRNKKISADYKKTLLNFCSLLHLILRSKPDKKEKVVQKILETKQKIEGPWLLQVAEEYL